jgi:hypothetical protein
MENEKHRWSYMTEEQLARRLKKITIPAKLNCFIDMAGMRGNDYLYQLAEERQIDLGMVVKARLVNFIDGAKVKKKVAEKWNKEKEKEIDERYLEF